MLDRMKNNGLHEASDICLWEIFYFVQADQFAVEIFWGVDEPMNLRD